MKKFASILTAAMLLASMLVCSVPAGAATSTSIDATQKGSVTLHKYDSSKHTSGENGVTGGSPVEGAGFSFYEILSYDGSGYKLTELATNAINAYNTTQTDDSKKYDLDKVIDSIVVTKTEADPDVAGDDGYASYGSTDTLENLIAIFQTYISKNNVGPTKQEIATDKNGTATASELDLGVYMVVETTVPNGYIASTSSFLVTVPQWDNTEKWQYNVNAFPKDEPYDTTVDKTIFDGSKKVDTDSLAIGDTVTYNVDGKVPNYGKSKASYQVEKNVTDATDFVNGKYYTKGADGKYTRATEYVAGTTYYAYNKDGYQVNLTNNTAIVTKETYDVLPFVFEDKLSDGLTYANNLEIKVSGKSDALKQDTNAKLANGKVTWSTGGDAGDYYVEYNSTENKLKVIVKWDSLDNYQGNKITFSYNAVINDKAVVTNGNDNTATITVANNPATYTGDYTLTDETQYTSSTDTATVYTYELDLTKTFNGRTATEAAVNASAVKFKLAEGNTEDDEDLYFLNTADGKYTLWKGVTKVEDGKTYAVVDKIGTDGKVVTGETAYATGAQATSVLTTELAVGRDGTLNIKGLDNKTYYVTETATVDGYSVLAQSVPVKVSDVALTTTNTTTYYPFVAYSTEDFDPNQTYYTKNGDKYTEIDPSDLSRCISNDSEVKVVYYEETKTTTGNASSTVEAEIDGGQELVTEGGIVKLGVNNSKNQFNLPLTGALGLWMFTIAGGVVMAAAIIFFSVLRKKKAKKASEK